MSYVAPAPAVHAAHAPMEEHIASTPVVLMVPATVIKCIVPAPAVSYVASAPAMYVVPAPVVEVIARRTETSNSAAATHLLKLAINRLNNFFAPKLDKPAQKADRVQLLQADHVAERYTSKLEKNEVGV